MNAKILYFLEFILLNVLIFNIEATTQASFAISPSNVVIDGGQSVTYTITSFNGVGTFNAELYNVSRQNQQGVNFTIAFGNSNTISFSVPNPKFTTLPSGWNVGNFVPIAVTNVEPVLANNDFQLRVVFNGLNYTNWTANSLKNVGFSYLNGTKIPSYLDFNQSDITNPNQLNLQKNITYWLKISPNIPLVNLTSWNSTLANFTSEPSCGTSYDSQVSSPWGVHGLFVMNNTANTATSTNSFTYLSNDPRICGVLLNIPWSQIEPQNGTYNWSGVSNTASRWIAKGKKIAFTIASVSYSANPAQLPAQATPAWVVANVPVVDCSVVDKASWAPNVPIYWNPGRLALFEAMVSNVINHYSTNSSVAYIRFGYGVGGESFPFKSWGLSDANSVSCSALWGTNGLTMDRYQGYVVNVINYEGIFSQKKQLLAAGLDTLNGSYGISRAEQFSAINNSIGFGISGLTYGENIKRYLGKNANVPCSGDWCSGVNQYQGIAPFYMQPTATTCPAGYAPGAGNCDVGSLNQLLSFETMLHVQISENRPDDYLIAVDPNWVNYTTYHSQYNSIITQSANFVGWATPQSSVAVSNTALTKRTVDIILMDFAPKSQNLFDGITVGETGVLSLANSGNCNTYDNGNSIFLYYRSFCGLSSLPTNWLSQSNSVMVFDANSVRLTTNSPGTYNGIYANVPFSANTVGNTIDFIANITAGQGGGGTEMGTFFGTPFSSANAKCKYAIHSLSASTNVNGCVDSSLSGTFTNTYTRPVAYSYSIWNTIAENVTVNFNFVGNYSNGASTTNGIWLTFATTNAIGNSILYRIESRQNPPQVDMPKGILVSHVIPVASYKGQLTQNPSFSKLNYMAFAIDTGNSNLKSNSSVNTLTLNTAPLSSQTTITITNTFVLQQNYQTLTATIYNGSSPYTFNFLITNSINGNVIANGIFSSSNNTYASSLQISNTVNSIGLVNANVIITDGATVPITVNSPTVTFTINKTTVNLIASPPGTGNFVSYTFTNNQKAQTGMNNTNGTFQQFVVVNSLIYKSYESSNLNNTVWFYANGTVIPAFIECNNLNTSTNTCWWLKFSNTILANGGTTTIYQGWFSHTTNFDGVNTGELSNLSNSYGKYDNGGMVFKFYDSFAGNTLNSTRWLCTQSCSGTNVVVNNGLTLTNSIFQASLRTTFSPNVINQTFEAFASLKQPALSGNFMKIGYMSGATVTTNVFYFRQSKSTGTNVISANSLSQNIYTPQYPVSGNVMLLLSSNNINDISANYLLGAENSISFTSLTTNPYLLNINKLFFHNNINGDTGANETIYFARFRISPPYNIMPTSTYGGVRTSIVVNAPVLSNTPAVQGEWETITSAWSPTTGTYNVLYSVINAFDGTVCQSQAYNGINSGNTFTFRLSPCGTQTYNTISANEPQLNISVTVTDNGVPQLQQKNSVLLTVENYPLYFSLARVNTYLDIGQTLNLTAGYRFVGGNLGYTSSNKGYSATAQSINVIEHNSIIFSRETIVYNQGQIKNLSLLASNGVVIIGNLQSIILANGNSCKASDPTCVWTLAMWNSSIMNTLIQYPFIHYWEFYNEPQGNSNLNSYVGDTTPNNAAVAYNLTQMTKGAYAAIKAHNSIDTFICLGGFTLNGANDNVNITRYMWKDGAASYCDAVSLHGYTGGTGDKLLNQVDSQGNRYVKAWTNSIIQEENITHLPIWITETGFRYYGSKPGFSQVNQSTELNFTYGLFSNFSYIDHYFWFDYGNGANDQFALINGSTINPSWTSFLGYNNTPLTPLTYNFILSNVITSQITTSKLNVQTTTFPTNSFYFTPLVSMVGNTMHANVVLSGAVIYNSIYTNNIIINSAFTNSTGISISNSPLNLNQVESITLVVAGGTTPYHYNFTISNSINGNIIINYNSVTSSSSNTFIFTLPIGVNAANAIGLLNVNGIIKDNATTPAVITENQMLSLNLASGTVAGGGGGSTTTSTPSNAPSNTIGTPYIFGLSSSSTLLIVVIAGTIVLLLIIRRFKKS